MVLRISAGRAKKRSAKVGDDGRAHRWSCLCFSWAFATPFLPGIAVFMIVEQPSWFSMLVSEQCRDALIALICLAGLRFAMVGQGAFCLQNEQVARNEILGCMRRRINRSAERWYRCEYATN